MAATIPCSIARCPNPAKARGWCSRHYEVWRQHGDPTFPAAHKGLPLLERFWGSVDRHGPVPRSCPELGRCWVFTGPRSRRGYGQFRGGHQPQGSRYSWSLETGETLTRDIEICHHCDNPPCVRFSHLFKGTHAQNMADMSRKGRTARRKLTDAEVLAARMAFAAGQDAAAIAQDFGIHTTNLYRLLRGITYRHSPGPTAKDSPK